MCQAVSRVKYLDGLFANTSVASGDNDDFPRQVRNVVDGELGLWSEVGFHKYRIEHPPEDAEGGEEAGAGHERNCCWREDTLGGGWFECKRAESGNYPIDIIGSRNTRVFEVGQVATHAHGLAGECSI